MTSAKTKPKETQKARQDRDKRDYERLVKEVNNHLQHRSDGFWSWLDDTADTVTGWVNDGWDTVNDLVDTYVWDTTDKEAVAEAWVKDTYQSMSMPAHEYVYDTIDTVNEWVDTYVWDTTEKEAVAESWAKDLAQTAHDPTQVFVDNAAKAVTEWWDDGVNDAKVVIDNAGATVTEAVDEVVATTSDIINNISLVLGIGFDAAMAVLGGLPDLIAGLKDDLVNWFKFDIAEYQATMAKLSEGVERPEWTK
ncbi:hypothetical protein ES708_12571 [subsurface metagenome]